MKKVFLTLAIVAILSPQSWAANLFYDTNGATAGAGGASPTGTWNAANTNWSTDSTGSIATLAWVPGNTAIFAAGTDASGAYNVTVTGTQSLNGLTVEEGAISQIGGTLDFGATANAPISIATSTSWTQDAASVFAGTAGLTKSGAGTLTLRGTNTFNSAGALLTITGGIVDFTADAQLGGVPTTARAAAITINGGTLRATLSSATTLALNRGITIGASGGTIDVPNTSNTGFSLPSAASFTLNGAGTLTKTGAGRFTMNTTSNSFTGKYVVKGGDVNVPGDGRFGLVPASVVADYFTLDGGGLRSALTSATSWSSNRGITLGAGGGTLYQPGGGTTVDSLTYNGIIAGTASGNLTIASLDAPGGGSADGIVILGGVNTYNGNTSITTGTTLRIAVADSIPSTSVVTLGGAGAMFDMATNNLNDTIKSIAGTAGTFAVGTATLTLNDPQGESYSSVLTGAAGGKVVKNGSGLLSLSGGSSGFQGEFVLNTGTIGVGGTAIFGSAAAGTEQLTINGGKLANTSASGRTMSTNLAVNLSGNFTVDDSLITTGAGLIAFGGVNTIKGGNRTITTNFTTGATNQNMLSFTSPVGEDAAGRGIIKKGNGTLTLGAVNTYSGDTQIDAGTISLGASTATLGNGAGNVILNGGTLNATTDRSGAGQITTNPVNVLTSSTISSTGTGATPIFEFSGALTGTAGQTLTFQDNVNAATQFKPRFSGTFTMNANIDMPTGTGTSVNHTQLESFNTTGTLQTFNGVISGTGTYNRSASASGTGGDTVFTANNTYSGGTTVNRGSLTVTNTTGSGTGSGGITVNSQGVLNVGDGTAKGAVSGSIADGGIVNFNRSDNVSYGSPTVSISGVGVVNKRGAGTLSLPNANSYSGTTTQFDGGLNLGDKASLGTGGYTIGDATTTTTLKVSSSANLTGANAVANAVTVARDFTVATGSSDLELSGTVGLGAVNRTITVDSSNATILSGVISDTGGTGGITKQGGGILTITGANTYGTVGVTSTIVTAGKLRVSNTTGSGTGPGNVLVNGGILGGTGTIGGSVTVTSGALSPGSSINVLNIGGSLTFTGGAFDYEINRDVAPAVGADLNNVTGNLALTSVALSASDLGVGALPLAMGTKFTLINYGGSWNGGIFTGYANHSTNLVIGLNRWQIDYDNTTGGSNFGGGSVGGGSHFVTITAVPEASAFLVIGLGGIFAIAAVRMGKRMGINVLKA